MKAKIMAKLTCRKQLKANNGKLKTEVKQLKNRVSFIKLIKNVRKAGFFTRLSFCYTILFKKELING